MSCPQCFAGHVNPDTPKGRWDTVHGRRTYVAEPDGGQPARGVVVIIPDAFGVDFVNNQILADHYASAGQFLVYLPEFMDGNACPVRTMYHMAHIFDREESLIWKPYYVAAVLYDFVPFMVRNRFGVSWPRVTSFLRELRRGKGATLPVGVAGFCWGGLHSIRLTHDTAEAKTPDGKPLIDASFIAHPSNLAIPSDYELVTLPLSTAIGDDDAVMGMADVKQAQQVSESKSAVTEVVVYPGAKHGFAVRASRVQPDAQETKQAEEAEQQAVAWFQRHFTK